ncbi:holo-ACP synthase [Rickettsiales bacterium]|nr:holo-ACP synthase [Rickettsiales bacterium]MDB2550570.1 holo-ACP synthase [Rickettsiales bacterium]
MLKIVFLKKYNIITFFKVNYIVMILGLGLDIVQIVRIKNINSTFGDNFLKKIYTSGEIYQINSISSSKKKEEFLAKRFAAKEAFSKALGTGIGRIKFNEIEVCNDDNGKPKITRTDKINQLIKELFTVENYQINLSIADDAGIAQAIVIISIK